MMPKLTPFMWEDLSDLPNGCAEVKILYIESGVIKEVCSCDVHWLTDDEKPDMWKYNDN